MISYANMSFVKENDTIIEIEKSSKISKEMDVFYNPVMKMNRDISVLILKALGKKEMHIGLPLEGSGIRGIRFLKELDKKTIKTIAFNDYSDKAVKSIKKNLQLNGIRNVTIEKICNYKENKKIKEKKVQLYCEEANLFLLHSHGFDYIDIDPFGTSNPFLDSALKRIGREGILAITNTDTASLAGTYPSVCKRLYWATPKHGNLMHELGLRILIRKVQLIGMQYEKALIPIFSYFKDHYFRVFFRCVKGKKECDKLVKQYGFFAQAGPLWLGPLFDEALTKKMHHEAQQQYTKNSTKEIKKEKKIGKNIENVDSTRDLLSFLSIIKDESGIPAVGFFETHETKAAHIVRKDVLIKQLKKKGFLAAPTHFSGTAIRTNAPIKIIMQLAK